MEDVEIEYAQLMSTANKCRRTNSISGVDDGKNKGDSHQSILAHDEDHENVTATEETTKAEITQPEAEAKPKAIPNGWDRTVFDNHPANIQTELASIDGDQRPVRRPHGQAQQLTLGRMFGRSDQRRPQAVHVVEANGERERDLTRGSQKKNVSAAAKGR